MNLGLRVGALVGTLILTAYTITGLSVAGFFAYSAFFAPRTTNVQHGYRGTGLVLIYNSDVLKDLSKDNALPLSVPYAGDEGQSAGSVYKNLKVLKDVPVGEFTRLMVSMARWVAPAKGCAACHNLQNFADDSLYTKVVARRMLQMTRHINADWTKHVGQTGVTCYTCHRGGLVPPNIWFNNPDAQAPSTGFAQPAMSTHVSKPAAGSALPVDPFTPFLEQKNDIRVSSTTPLPSGDHHSIKDAQMTYSLMLAFSKSLGVNCDFCHNTRSFYSWAVSPPQRVTAWYGIRMVRDLNSAYLDPLRETFPPERRGALGDAPKLYCATCHNGVYKPLFGAKMADDFPELKKALTDTAQNP